MSHKVANSTEYEILRALQEPFHLRRGILPIPWDSTSHLEIYHARQEKDSDDVSLWPLLVLIWQEIPLADQILQKHLSINSETHFRARNYLSNVFHYKGGTGKTLSFAIGLRSKKYSKDDTYKVGSPVEIHIQFIHRVAVALPRICRNCEDQKHNTLSNK